MAAILLSGRVRGVQAVVSIKLENINWIPLDANTTVAQDALPTEIFTVAIHTEKGSFVWYAPEPDKPSWWERLLGK